MRVVLDTNVLISALLVESSLPAQLIVHWRQGRFVVLTAEPQFDELRQVTRYPKLRDRLSAPLVGRLINDIRKLSQHITMLPKVEISPDPYDNYLLAIAVGGAADYLVTGDKSDLLMLGSYNGIKITSVRDFLGMTQLGVN